MSSKLTTGQKAGGTLAAVVGTSVATALLIATPMEESGREVRVTMDEVGKATVTHVRGKQYLRAYLDMVGVATACDGLTRDEFGRKIRITAFYTEAQCAAMLERALITHAKAVLDCSPGLALSPVPAIERRREGPRFAAISGAYNYGPPTYCRSTALKRFNSYDYPGGCAALTWFNKAGGKVVRGLVLRRERENKVCLGGLGMVGK